MDLQATLWPDLNATDPAEVQNDYNKHASTYRDTVMSDGWRSTFDRITPFLRNILPPKNDEITVPKQILDAGCGDGLLPDQFDFTDYNVTLYGIDLSPEMLARAKAKEKYVNLKVVNMAEEIPLEDESFDVVVSNGVLGYIACNKPLYEFVRTVRRGGYVLFTMRESHFNERGYPEALEELSGVCEVKHKEGFSSFPNNPAYKHTYLFVVVYKKV